MDDLVVYIILVCSDKTSVSAAERVTHLKGMQATVTFLLEVLGDNCVTIT